MVKKICAVLGTLTLATFIIGLAQSITSGFAGFWGGLPFWIIAIVVLSMAAYDAWEETFARKKNGA
ncbi:MAG: hypothetical protein NXI16_09200 [Alphaproteobacteria bacterium]|nr:hypothetical protein [Alphaproteobacteria bacterium]